MRTSYDVIVRPIVTENSMLQTSDRKYTFEVLKDANKTEIKKAVEAVPALCVEHFGYQFSLPLTCKIQTPRNVVVVACCIAYQLIRLQHRIAYADKEFFIAEIAFTNRHFNFYNCVFMFYAVKINCP